jgi:hypothetical protein
MSRNRDSDYSNAQRVRNGQTQFVRVPPAVLGQLLSELEEDGRIYAGEVLGAQLVQACIAVAYREQDDEDEENAA